MATTALAACRICSGPTGDDPSQGCTVHTCTTPCDTCGHPGYVHKDWYVHHGAPVFCQACGVPYTGPEHSFTAADCGTEE